MSNNTLGLDEILSDFEFTIGVDDRHSDIKKDDAKARITDWHNAEVVRVLDRLQNEQRAWMHEHAELNLGYATYLLTNIKNARNQHGYKIGENDG